METRIKDFDEKLDKAKELAIEAKSNNGSSAAHWNKKIMAMIPSHISHLDKGRQAIYKTYRKTFWNA